MMDFEKVKLLRVVLEAAVETDGGTSDGGEDQHDRRACCHKLHWHPHAKDCWVPRAKAALAATK